MATIQDVVAWAARDLSRFGENTTHCSISVETEQGEKPKLRVVFYTDINRYTIVAYDGDPPPPAGTGRSHDGSYLGCSAASRKTRAGEDWHRGRDLAEGSILDWTWHRILSDIVSYEMVKIHKPEPQPAMPAPSYDALMPASLN